MTQPSVQSSSELGTVAYAQGYGRLGWRVFPVWAEQKRPIYKGWPTDATTDPALIDQYFAADPSRNIGLVCGEQFDAWDIEVEHIAALTAWMTENGHVLPESPLAQTGRGGWHYLTQPTGVNHTRALHLNGTHVGELKSMGGFIVAAPSKTTGPYLWQWTPRHMELSPPPPWLLGLLERPQGATHRFPSRLTSADDVVAVLTRLAAAVTDAGEGHRNNYLYWAMRRALEEGVPVRHAGRVLLAAGLEAGLEDHEVKATLRSAYEAEGDEA